MKRLIKRLMLKIFAVFFRDDRPKVVYYHDVGPRYTDMGTPVDVFWAHMALLRDGDVVCFDDGFRGIWDERERFKSSTVRPTVFIAVDLVGRPGYLTWDEILELQRLGFRFECHTWTHQDLTQFNDQDLRREVVDARNELARHLGRPVEEICFPIGYFSDKVLAACRKAGYRKMYVSYPGVIAADSDIVPRNLVQNSTVAEFRDVLQGGLLPLKNRYLKQHYRREER